MIHFGRIIKEHREAKGWTQSLLASRVSIESSFLSAVETGRKDPSLTLLRRLCKHLEIPVELLLWESVEFQDGLKKRDQNLIAEAKKLIRNLFAPINNNNLHSRASRP